MQLKTKAIVLKQRNIGENDRILTLLSKELGIIEVSARSVKSTKSALSGPCQILAYSEFCLYKGKSNYIVNSAESINSFYNLRLDVVKVALAGYFCQLTNFLSPTAENSWVFLRLLLNTLYFLQEDKHDEEILKSIFELRALSLAGFMPDLVCCSECGVFESELMYFLPLNGIAVCENCFKKLNIDNETTIKFIINPPVLSCLRHILYSSEEKLFSFKLTGGALLQLSFITENYTLLHTEANFPSLEMYKSLKL